MADSVLIEGLVVETVVGVYDWERKVDQRLLVDLEMAWDNRVPGASDDVGDALDYAAVSELVTSCLQALQPSCWSTVLSSSRRNCSGSSELPGWR